MAKSLAAEAAIRMSRSAHAMDLAVLSRLRMIMIC
jgi:hypothetical protein